MPEPERPRLIEWLLGRRGDETTHGLLRNDRLAQLLVILVWMLVVGGAFYGIAAVLPFVLAVSDILTPFILALILAYILNPALRYFQRRFDLSRLGVVVITYVLFGGIVLLVFSLLVPLLVEQGLTLMARAKEAAERTKARTVIVSRGAPGADMAPLDSIMLDEAETTGTLLPSGHIFPDELGTTVTLAHASPPGQIASEAGPMPPQSTTAEEKDDWLDAASEATRRGFESLNLTLVRWWESFSLDVSELSTSIGTMRSAAAATTNVASRVGLWLGSAVLNLVALVVLVSLVIVICFYMLVDYSRMVETFWSAVPIRHHRRTAVILAKIDYSLGGFLRGQLLICVIVGAAWTLWLVGAMGLARYALLIGFVAGVINFIPYLGPGIGAVSASLYVLLSPEYAGGLQKLWGISLALIGLTIIQTLDGFILQPKLIGPRANLHPLMIILALLAGGQFGLGGLLMAVPMACIAMVLWRELVWERYLAHQRAESRALGDRSLAKSALVHFDETQRELNRGVRVHTEDDPPATPAGVKSTGPAASAKESTPPATPNASATSPRPAAAPATDAAPGAGTKPQPLPPQAKRAKGVAPRVRRPKPPSS